MHFGKNPVRVTRAVIVSLAIGLVCSSMRGARADDPAALPIVAISGLSPTYLSTAPINATITVTNPTAQTIHVFQPTLLDGSNSSPTVQIISRTSSRTSRGIDVEPGQTIRFDQPFPKCVVLADPCVERVTASLRLTEPPGEIKSAEYRYTILPDPSATFRIDRLSGNRPVVLWAFTESKTVGFITPALELFVPWDPLTRAAPPARDAAHAILAAHGVTVPGGTRGDSKGITEDYDLLPTDDFAMIAATLRDVQEHLGDRVTLRLVFLNERAQSGPSIPGPDTAYGVANYLGIEPLDDSSSMETREYSIPGAQSESPFVGEAEFARFAFGGQPRPAVFTVLESTSIAQVGSQPAVIPVPVASLRDERYDVALYSEPAPLTRLVIADDRTQVYAGGFADAAAAASRGVDPQAASVDIAMRRCRELAGDLGLGVGPLTLAVVYPRSGQGPAQIAATGVAMATTGMMPLPALRPTPPPATPVAMPRPPTPATAGPIPTSRYVPATVPPAATPPQSKQTTSPYPVPIDVYDVGDTLIYSGNGMLVVPADELLLTVEVETSPASSGSSSAHTPISALRADPRVESAALVTATSAATRVERYHVVVRSVNPGSARNIVNVLRGASVGHVVRTASAYVGALRSCRAAGALVVRAAAHEALVGAAKSASFLGLNVRRLIFATGDGPITESGRCAPDANSDGFPDASADAPAPNAPPLTVTFHADVRLTFRAFRFGT